MLPRSWSVLRYTRRWLRSAVLCGKRAPDRAVGCLPWVYLIVFSVMNPQIFRWYLVKPLPPNFSAS